jgi:hypothetical protein
MQRTAVVHHYTALDCVPYTLWCSAASSAVVICSSAAQALAMFLRKRPSVKLEVLYEAASACSAQVHNDDHSSSSSTAR